MPGEVQVELPIDAHIPAEYVPHERLRLEAYKRLADAASDAAVDEVAAELLDRYGPCRSPSSRCWTWPASACWRGARG